MAFTPAGENIRYTKNDEAFEGYYVAAQGTPKGSVIIIHDWDGLDDYERQRADMLAKKGYNAFALDIFGANNRPQAIEDKQAATNRLYQDRKRMRQLTEAGIEAANAQGADNSVLLGYCFGGTLALEMARAGTTDNIIGYASFHGGLQIPEGQQYDTDTAPIFIAHGGADNIVSLDDVVSLAGELEEAAIEYEIGIYANAPHAFSVFNSDRYHETADQRSWETFTDWLRDNIAL
ncbi:dienelactone hydrolase family protein [Halomonas vilamensis]|uniref:Dienelactone hydrolase family protein n=1 Tax=Vreelandella vilamensis TaxID=531309 RepID=A0ABU1H435_9GAMM|nr:dienelactone hydrolase family protein [Halomonas vilamensis]MDR5898303.1 dienelactone hydrolase family protein [Halomonas vilamensis]